MELALVDQVGLALLELAEIGRGEREYVLALLLLRLLDVLDALLESGAEVAEARIVRQYLGEYDERVAHLHVLLGLEADDEALGELVVPLVAHVAKVLVVELLLPIGRCGCGGGSRGGRR